MVARFAIHRTAHRVAQQTALHGFALDAGVSALGGVERRFGVAIGHQLHAPEKATSADVTHVRVIGEGFAQQLLKVRAIGTHLGHELVALKTALASDLGLGIKAYGEKAQKLIERVNDQGLSEELFGSLRANLEITQNQSTSRLESACKLLEKSSRVHVAGFRASYAIAFGLVYPYRLFRPDVQLLDGQGGTLEMQQRAMSVKDALIVISFAPYSREALQVAEAAKQAGCRIVALTDSFASPLSLIAQETLLFSVRSPSFFPSVAAGLGLAEALVQTLASRAGASVVGRINEAERLLHRSGAYIMEPEARVHRPA